VWLRTRERIGLTEWVKVKAEENVVFWVAVEFFRNQHISTPNTGAMMRKRFSETLKTPVYEDGIENVQIYKINPRHSVMMEDLMTREKLESLQLDESQLNLLSDAARVFKTFLEDEASHWACIEMRIVDEIRNKIKAGEVDPNLFSKAQHQAFQTMNIDLFPRFLKAIVENPQRYSTGERFELPTQTISELEEVMSATAH
jgi:hypothetical protein